jgi:hypothetical protein
MKPFYEIESSTFKTNKFFYLFNYHPFNKLTLFGFSCKREFNSDYLIGVWKIKQN